MEISLTVNIFLWFY